VQYSISSTSTGYNQFGQPISFTGDIVTEMYSYTQPGQAAAKRLRVARQWYTAFGNGTLTADLNATWDYTSKNEGHLMGATYPAAAASYMYSYDAMGRLNTMTDGNGATLVNGAQYNAAGQMTSMGGFESRSYNSMGQLTNINYYGSVNTTYTYSPTQNNGKITSQTDNLSGEQVTYAYDSLNRLTSATASGWNQGFVYDPFGNLTDKTGTNSWHGVPDATTNHLGGVDANGNALYSPAGASLAYDAENRLISAGPATPYAYDGQNKRIWTCTVDPNSGCHSEIYYFYSPQGKLMAQFTPEYQAGTLVFQNGATRAYFGGRLLGSEDRLGSRGKYYPYGEDRSSPPPTNDQVKFVTYTRDSATGMDYADQRYYASTYGRFMSPDPYMASGGPTDPSSWNRYAYTRGDPVNRFDPSGLQDEGPPMLPFFGYCPDGSITFYGASPCPIPPPGNLWGWVIGPAVIDLSGLLRLFLPKSISGGTNVQAKMVGDAYVDALLRLNMNPECHDALTNNYGLDATTTLQDTDYRILDLGDANAGASTNPGFSVFLNSGGAFFNAVPDADGHVTLTIPSTTVGGPKTAITFQSQASAGAFLLLHELGHETGLFGSDAGMGTINAQHSWVVLDKCFGIKPPGGQ